MNVRDLLGTHLVDRVACTTNKINTIQTGQQIGLQFETDQSRMFDIIEIGWLVCLVRLITNSKAIKRYIIQFAMRKSKW